MRLFLTATSERGKPITKSGNDYLIMEVLDHKRKPLITLHLTSAHSHLEGDHYNAYIKKHQDIYLAQEQV